MFWRSIPRATDVLARPEAPPLPPLPTEQHSISKASQRSAPPPSAPPPQADSDQDEPPPPPRPRPRSRLSFSGRNALKKAVQEVIADERMKHPHHMSDVVLDLIEHEKQKPKAGKGLPAMIKRRRSVGELLKLKKKGPDVVEEPPSRITPFKQAASSSSTLSESSGSGSSAEELLNDRNGRRRVDDAAEREEQLVQHFRQTSLQRRPSPSRTMSNVGRSRQPGFPVSPRSHSSFSTASANHLRPSPYSVLQDDDSAPPVYSSSPPSAIKRSNSSSRPYPSPTDLPASRQPPPPVRPPSRTTSAAPERRATVATQPYETRRHLEPSRPSPARSNPSSAFGSQPSLDPYQRLLRQNIYPQQHSEDEDSLSDASSASSPSRRYSDEDEYNSDASSLAPAPPSTASFRSRTSSPSRKSRPSSVASRSQALPLPPPRPPLPKAYSGATVPPTATPTSLKRPKQVSPVGLANLGNTCYLNCVLQALAATKPLASFFLTGEYEKEINTQTKFGTKGELPRAMAHLLRSLLAADRPSVSPSRLRTIVARAADQFDNREQHDAHELLLWLLDKLHEDLNLVLDPPPVKPNSPAREAELEQLPELIAADQEWAKYRERNDSVVIDFFQGQLRNRMECLRCQQTSTTFEPLHTLSLSIPSPTRTKPNITLKDCFDDFLREEILDGDNAWNCPHCRRPRPASKRFLVARLPQFLIIHLKRFAIYGSFSSKIDTPVSFPLDGLELGGLLSPGVFSSQYSLNLPHERNTTYELYALCTHLGGDGDGHYKAVVRQAAGWCQLDDDRVTELSEKDVQANASSAYMLFFRARSS
ncbi:hypothetical protein JCM11641_004521 [Rhodosporidiobolus odoratus]